MGCQRCRKRKCILTNEGSKYEKVEDQSNATKRRQTGLQKCRESKCILTNKESEYEKVEEQKKTTKIRKTDGVSKILTLPIVLIYEILSWLPINSILRCKCVCKTFLRVTTDPCFIEKTCNIEHRMVVVDKLAPFNLFSFRMLDLEKRFPPSLSCSLTRDEDQNDSESFNSWHTLSMPNSIAQICRFGTHLFGSCNGLVCVSYSTISGCVYCICNPILGEYLVLSPPTSTEFHLVGFGYFPKTKQYKVIQFLRDSYCNVLTLGQDSWRRINNVPYPYRNLTSVGPSYNGYLHWHTEKLKTEKWICSLNFETEEVKYVPLPTFLNLREMSEINLAVFDGSFCVNYIASGRLFEICAMKDYGVRESWTKMVVIKLDSNINPVLRRGRLLNNGIQLLERYKCPLVYYNTRRGIKKVVMTEGSYDALDYFPSLFSLKNIVGAKNVEIARCNRHHNFFPDKETPFILKQNV